MLLVLLGLHLSHAIRWDEEFTAKNTNVEFIGKFCFDKGFNNTAIAGMVNIKVKVPTAQLANNSRSQLRVYFMSDQPTSWPALYKKKLKKTLTCEEAETLGSEDTNKPRLELGSQLDSALQNGGCDDDGFCTVEKPQAIRENYARWWFAMMVDCQQPSLDGISYELSMVNSQRKEWNKELGVDIMGLNDFYLVAFFVFLIFMIVHFYGVVQLSKKLEFVHPLVRLLAVCIILEFAAVVFYMIHYCTIWKNGVGHHALAQAAEVAEAFARCVFMLLLILVGKGWTVTNEELTGKAFIIGAILGFLLLHVLILIWKFHLEDPAMTVLATPLKVILYFELGLWFSFCVYFAMSTYQTFSKEDNPVKKKLFLTLMLFYIPWFALYPTINFLDLTSALGATHRTMIIASTSTVIAFIGYVILSFLTWPSRAEEYFNVNKPDVMTGASIDTYEQL